MDAKELAEEKAKLKPGQWIDYLPEPFETVADVEDLMKRVHKLQAEKLLVKLRKGTYYSDDPARA
jgi:hypothetical protein